MAQTAGLISSNDIAIRRHPIGGKVTRASHINVSVARTPEAVHAL